MTAPYYADDMVTLYHGDCLDVLRELPDASVDAVVTDPPYGLEFMGKEWDKFDRKGPASFENLGGPFVSYGRTAESGNFRDKPRHSTMGPLAMRAFGEWCEQWAAECLRVLKPGGHLLAFGGTRTWHRLACAVEDAGFEVRDSIAWLYGSGFPKSLDVSKAIDKAAGAERDRVPHVGGIAPGSGNYGGGGVVNIGTRPDSDPITDDARTWQGWGTALKPAFEPVVVARKPLAGMGINVVAVVESALRANGVTGDIRWRFGLASDVESPSQSPTSSAIPPLATAETSAAHVAGGATRNDARPTASSSASTMPNGERETASTSAPMPASATPNSETPSSLPTARIADAVEKAGASSSPSITSKVAERSTASRSTERSTRSSAEKVSHPVTESFAGIATGLSGSLATVRIERLPDGSFAWPAGLPFSTPGGSTTVAQNVLAHGTGALNIDACRINPGDEVPGGGGLRGGAASRHEGWQREAHLTGTATEPHTAGRWPANVVLDESQAAELDRQSGVSAPKAEKVGRIGGGRDNGTFHHGDPDTIGTWPADPGGGASRFFYVAKAPTAERPRVKSTGGGEDATTISSGLRVRECKVCGSRGKPAGGEHSGKPWPTCGHDDWTMVNQKPASGDYVAHPTVKPLDLMRWLVRLVTPPGGVVLEPFAGSGTTAEACVIEGFRCIAIEREADYLPLIVQRLTKPIQPTLFGDGAA